MIMSLIWLSQNWRAGRNKQMESKYFMINDLSARVFLLICVSFIILNLTETIKQSEVVVSVLTIVLG